MILIFLLCLKLSILHLCVSDLGYQCTRDDSTNDPKIFLIQDRKKTYSYNQDLLNFEFTKLCSNYYNIDYGSLEESKKYDNVIHFAVPNYYDGKLRNNFVYAGNISKIDDAVCTKTDKKKEIKNKQLGHRPPLDKGQPKFDCHEMVKLVSNSLFKLNDGHVYNFVQEMQIRESRGDHREITHRGSCEPLFRKTSDLTTVLLCLRGRKQRSTKLYIEVNIQPLRLIQVADCSSYFNEITMRWTNLNNNRLLAVLAPEPFEVPSEYSIPTIFYETPYLFSEDKTAFPNSMNLVPWRLLKYGFLKFIHTVGWQRVAIVTDDSEYSLDFEDELTSLFNKEQIIYTVIRCEDANCEMDKVAQELNRVPARIVIANVEEKHAQHLFQNAHHQITWLVRDMVGERPNQHLPNYQVAFSISLSIDTNTKGCDVEDNILTGLSSIAQVSKNIAEEDYNVKKREFYRRFANKSKQATPRITEAKVVVHKLYSLEVISTMTVNATGAKLNSFTNPFKSGKPTDGTAHCLVTSYDYHKPCEDPLVMFLMLTLMLFMLTFLLINCYFDKSSPFNDIRYHNF